jgi:aspartyl-tRNA(Asn)/glutamyl-tRNA(Gln) amidotransferase subunit A
MEKIKNKDICKLSIEEILSLLKTSSLTITEVLHASMEAQEKYRENNILITETFPQALAQQDKMQAGYQHNNNRPLEGIPVVLKDNICAKGIRNTCGSNMLHDYFPDYNAEVVNRLENSGAVIVGKANMDEFAMGSFGNYSFFKAVTNPWKDKNGRKYFSGGSSSGSAAAVSCGMVPVSLGTDTGGSVRLPAAWNGIVGFKPTYGAISRYGVIPLSSTLDTVSLFSRTVKDLEPVFNVLVGIDEKDSSSIDFWKLSQEKPMVEKKKVAIIKEFNDCPDVLPSIYKVKDYLESVGYVVEEISVPEVNYCLPLYANIVPIETMSNFARYDGLRYGLSLPEGDYQDYSTAVRTMGFGEEVKRRIVAGAYMASKLHSKERCLQAYGVKRMIENKFEEIFQTYDLILHPTSFSHAVAQEDLQNIDPISILKTDQYTVLANILGAPAISIPIDLHYNELPIGISLMANVLQDLFLLKIAKQVDEHF